MSNPAQPLGQLAARILDALPQTQCTRCGYPDCAAYARAIEAGEADINQCPPGGQAGVMRLAHITALPAKPLNREFGLEVTRQVVFIDENWCIGCTLCIDACPTDAIMGSNKRMHTVIEAYCTGCELCLPVCPVDCMKLETASGDATGWAAWPQAQADMARSRYAAKTLRSERTTREHDQNQQAQVQPKLADLAAHSRITNPAVLDHKRAIIEAAMARARAKRAAETTKE